MIMKKKKQKLKRLIPSVILTALAIAEQGGKSA
jgi:hypothetical protein